MSDGDEIEAAFRRLTSGNDDPEVSKAAATIAATVGAAAPEAQDLLDALVLLRWTQAALAAMEHSLIAAARAGGVSWQSLAPALGVASRQAAERRFLRLAPADQPGGTRDDRVQAERDRRAGLRAVARWANDNTADLRRLAGQVTALTDLDADAATDVGRLHHALADSDASHLPHLLANTQRHLGEHPDLADQITTVTEHTERVQRQTERRRGAAASGG